MRHVEGPMFNTIAHSGPDDAFQVLTLAFMLAKDSSAALHMKPMLGGPALVTIVVLQPFQ